MPVYYDKTEGFAKILDPTDDYRLSDQPVEHRKDPLTGEQCTVLRDRYGYTSRFFETDEDALIRYAEETKGRCPFCPVALEASTPRFPPEVAVEGRIRFGEAVTFPSLFAHAEYNAVTVLSAQHMLPLDGFTPKLLRDGITASLEYLKRIQAVDEKVSYASLVVNYLPPAGSTVVHPHMQTLASSVPFHKLKILLEASKGYFERWRSSYWGDLVVSEKKRGERYIGKVASSEWVLPFSPRGFYEVVAILPERVSLLELTGEDLEGITEGLSRVLRYYRDRGVWSFNIAFYSGPLRERLRHFSLNLKVVARYGFRQVGVNDIWALHHLLGESEVYEAPEDSAPALRSYFK